MEFFFKMNQKHSKIKVFIVVEKSLIIYILYNINIMIVKYILILFGFLPFIRSENNFEFNSIDKYDPKSLPIYSPSPVGIIDFK